MTAPHASWSIDAITPEARRAAEAAAEAAGMPLEAWLNQLIKYVSTMELKARAAAQQAHLAAEAEHAPAPSAAPDAAPVRPALARPAPSLGAPPLAGGQPTRQLPGMPPAAVPLASLRPSPLDAREEPNDRDIEAALEHWRRTGMLEPVLVRPIRVPGADAHDEPEAYEIVAGIERWHAAQRVQMRDVPVIVHDMSDADVIQATLIRQIKRQTLAPLEEARAYRRLMTDVSMNTEDLARAVGKTPSHVATMLRLLDLPEAVLKMLESDQLTVMHARALLNARDPEGSAREVVARRLDIYQTEQLVRATGNERAPRRPAINDNVATSALMERQLSNALGLKVSIAERNDVGVVSIHFVNRDQLAEIVMRLNGTMPE
jgi:ParB family chromosome partitioning protein